MDFDLLGYQALKSSIVNVLTRADYGEGKKGVTSGFIVLPLKNGIEASVRCVFANTFMMFGSQCDTSNQWLEYYEKALKDADLPIKVIYVPSDGTYDFPYLHVQPVYAEVSQKRKYSLV